MKEKLGYKNEMAVPKIEKVIINTGFGRLIAGKTSDEQKKILDNILNDLSLIAGQQAVLTKAKKSISGFKIRQGMAIGAKVTLRRNKIYFWFRSYCSNYRRNKRERIRAFKITRISDKKIDQKINGNKGTNCEVK